MDDPIERIFAYHRKAERQLALLGRLPVHLEATGIDPEASAIAAGALHCFGAAMALHQADEERDLLPLIERRIADAAELERFRALRAYVESDHRAMGEAWRALRRPLSAIAEGLRRRVPEEPLGYFRVLSALHIGAEEAAVHVLAHRYLRPGDREALARRMQVRRAATKASPR